MIFLSAFCVEPTLALSDQGSSVAAAGAAAAAASGSMKPSLEELPRNTAHVPFSKPQTAANQIRSDIVRTDGTPELFTLRGGEQYPQSNSDPYEQPAMYNPNQNNYEDGFANYNPPPPTADFATEDVFHESVQDRVDKWRNEQLQKYGHLTPQQEANPRDETGRTKLVQHVSKGARATIFILLMWRDMTLFDIADQSIKGVGRGMVRTFVTIMFVGNLVGAVASCTSPSHSAKRRMKMILNVDKLVEIVLLLWYFLRLTILPSDLVPREIFFAGAFHSLFFLLEAHSFTRLTWDENIAPPKPPVWQQHSTAPYDELSAPQRTRDDEPSSLYVSNPTYQGNYNDNGSY
jgi:hypothetical protein